MTRLNPHTWLLFLCAMLLSACAQLGLQAPQTTEDKVQYGYSLVGGAYRTIGDQAAAKTLSPTKAKEHFVQVQSLEEKVRLADDLTKQGKPVDAAGVISLALTGLLELKTQLEKKQ